jgi:hypothetical protein
MIHFQTTATSIIINVTSIQKLFIYKFCSSNKNFDNEVIEMESWTFQIWEESRLHPFRSCSSMFKFCSSNMNCFTVCFMSLFYFVCSFNSNVVNALTRDNKSFKNKQKKQQNLWKSNFWNGKLNDWDLWRLKLSSIKF